MATKKKAAPGRAAARKKTATRAAAKQGGDVSVKQASAPQRAAAGPGSWDNIERLFDDFLQRRLLHPFRWPRIEGWPNVLEQKLPSVDVVEHDNEVVVRAEVPGIDKKDLEVSVSDRMLSIRGSTRREKKEAKGNFYRREIRSGAISRSLLLPADVDVTKVKANLKDGVVELRLPKLPGSKRQKIPLS
jgi:HSP20 family protein